jgi:dolichol-phosphate mannosyltransferase
MRGRFASFATVGSLGFILQLGALALLTAAGWPYLVAAAIAVELAALHNFCWHERWTWCDRALPRRTVGRRLFDYHLTTASIAVAGNVVLTGAIVEISGAPPLLANVAAVAILAMVSFRVADRWVYVDRPEKRPQSLSGWTRMPAAARPSRSRAPRTPAPGVSL